MILLRPHLEELRKLYPLENETGFVDTHLPGVRFFWSTKPLQRAPLLYDAGIIIIGEGYKRMFLEDKSFRYDKDRYMVISVPLPLECETHASEYEPLLGIFIDINLNDLHKLVNKVTKHRSDDFFDSTKQFRGFEAVEMNNAMLDAAKRLIQCLTSELESDSIGHSLTHEILFRALLGKHGSALYALTQHHSHYARLARVLNILHESYMEPITIERLAENANMSVTTFYRVFKQVTGESPLQYLKKIRLGKARQLIEVDGMRAGVAAQKVGYESTSQFSREFKRHFNQTPAQVREF